MITSISLQGIGPAPKMELQLGERYNLLTGDNGLGKTFMLDIAWWALTNTWANEPAWPRPDASKAVIECEILGAAKKQKPFKSSYDFAKQKWNLPEAWPIKPGLVIYAKVDGGFAVWDPAKNYNTGARENAHAAPDSFQLKKEQVWEGLNDASGARVCDGLIRDWVNWQTKDNREFNMLCQVLKALSPRDEEMVPGTPVRYSLADVREVPTLKLPYGTVPVTLASAGMRRVMALAYLMVWTWQEHMQAAALRKEEATRKIVFLIDEIEAHLHPEWQRRILPALHGVVSGISIRPMKKRIDFNFADVQIIACSHSPLVAASLEPHFQDETDKIIHFDLSGDSVSVQPMHWAKQGDAGNWLVSEMFGLKQARSAEAERAIEAAEAFMRKETAALPVGLKTKDAIHKELLRVLAGHDAFWPRWIVKVMEGDKS